MNIFKCLRCGEKRHGTKPVYTTYLCDCGGVLIPITKNMVTVAERLHALGLQIREAQDYTSILLDHDNIRVMLVHIAFKRVYAPEVFRNLPAGWVYKHYPAAESPYCSVICLEHKDAFAVIPDTQEIKHIIREIDMWVRSELTEGNVAVYRLSGWI